MTYIAKLIHRALVERPTFAASSTDERVPTYATVTGMSAVHCLFVPGETQATRRLFGADVKLDGVVYFRGGVDIRPNLTTPKGDEDRLTISDERGNSLGVYFVTSTRNPMARNIMLIVGVRKAMR